MSGTLGNVPTDRGGRPAVVPGRAVGEARPAQPFLRSRTDVSGEVGLRQYLSLFGHHLKLMLLVGLLPLIAVVTYTFMQPKRYRVQAILHREEGRELAAARGQVTVLMTNQGAIREIRSGRLSEDVRRTLAAGGVQLPPAKELARMVQAVPDDRNQELTVVVVDTDCERAAQLANAYAQVIESKAEESSAKELKERKGHAREALDRKSKELASIAKGVLTERAKTGVPGTAMLPLPNEAEEISNQLIRLESRRQEAELQNRELEERLARLNKSLTEAGVRQPGVAPADLEKGLIKAELALAQAETKYNESHPTYMKLKTERDEIFKILQRKVDEQGGGPRLNLDDMQRSAMLLTAEKAGVEARIKAIGQFISEKREEVKKAFSGQTINRELADLLRQQKILEGIVMNLQKHVEGLEIPEGDLPNWELLSAATAPNPKDYFSPRWPMSLAVGLGLALALALMAAFVAENLEDRIRDQGDLLKNFRLPFLGPVPLRREGESLLIDLNQPRHLMSSIFEVLRNNINYALPAGVPKVVLVASGVVGEGKSTVASNLAVSYCLDGNNVLLIDTDLRRPRAHRLFENLCPQAMSSPGLAGYLAGRAKFEDVELRTVVPNLSFISAGKGAVNPSKLLGSEEMRRLMDHVARHYDVVVLDGPAVLPVVDSTVVSQFVSGVVLVVSCKHAPAEQVATAIARLEHVRARIVGMILNRVSIGSRGYGYFYGSRYGQGYGYGSGYHEGS